MAHSDHQYLEKLPEYLNKMYWINLGIALVSIIYDLTFQELIREQVEAKTLQLQGLAEFLNDNFVGDIGNAFGYVFFIPLLGEIVNWEIQKDPDSSEKIKRISELATLLFPFFMAVFFLAAATDGETTQTIFKWGTPDPKDLIGATYGTVVALASVLKFREKVYPRGSKKTDSAET